MFRRVGFRFLWVLVAVGITAGAGYCSQNSGKIGLKILYAGHARSDREKDFLQFLRGRFDKVDSVDLEGFREVGAESYDVTILDYDGDGFKSPRPQLSKEFSKPVVTVGVAGGLMSSMWGLKTGYL